MTRLQNGRRFPKLEIPAVGGGTIQVPESLSGSYGVVLIYRGHWCAYCNAQLAGFERSREKLAGLGIKVVAFSVDDEAATAELVEKHRLRFPVGHSAEVDKVAAATGAYVNDEPHHLHTTGFLLAPDGSILNAVYSSGPIGRLVADDVAGMVAYLKFQNLITVSRKTRVWANSNQDCDGDEDSYGRRWEGDRSGGHQAKEKAFIADRRRHSVGLDAARSLVVRGRMWPERCLYSLRAPPACLA